MINFKNKIEFAERLKELQKSENSVNFFCPKGDGSLVKTNKFLNSNSLVVTGFTPLVLDDLSAYNILFNNLSKLPIKFTQFDLIRCVQKSVFDYFGYSKPNEINRIQTYKNCFEKDINVSISLFKGTGNSWCLERATLCHNFLKLLGIDSVLISGDIELNGNRQSHCYNTYKINNCTYLLDLLNTPSSKDNIPAPICVQLYNENKLFDNKVETELNQVYSCNFVSKSGRLYHIDYLNGQEENEILCYSK